MKGQTESHDVGIVLAETQGRGVLRKRIQGHAEKVDVEFPVKIVQLVIALPVRRIRIHLFQTVLIIGALRIDTLPDGEELPVLHRNQGSSAEGTADLVFLAKSCLTRGEQFTADLAQILPFGTVVSVEILNRSSTAGAVKILRNFSISPTPDRFELAAVMAALVLQAEMLPVLVSGRDDLGKGVRLELFVLRRVRVIEGPLFQRYVSADKGEKPAILLVKSFDN